MTAQICRQKKIQVLGWIFNDEYMHYEEDIVRWSGYPKLGNISKLENTTKETIKREAVKIKESLLQFLQSYA
jgi:dethiobiotin synthetase